MGVWYQFTLLPHSRHREEARFGATGALVRIGPTPWGNVLSLESYTWTHLGVKDILKTMYSQRVRKTLYIWYILLTYHTYTYKEGGREAGPKST